MKIVIVLFEFSICREEYYSLNYFKFSLCRQPFSITAVTWATSILIVMDCHFKNVKFSKKKLFIPIVYYFGQVCLEGEISKDSIMSGLSQGKRASGDLIPWTISQQVCDSAH